MKELRRLNRRLGPKGLRVLPLRYSAERVLIYLYRPDRLEKDLSDREAAELLEKAGYSLSHSNKADVIVMYFLEEGNHDIYALNETLDHFEERTLS